MMDTLFPWGSFVVFLLCVGTSSAAFLNAFPSNFTPGLTEELVLECNIKSLLHAVNEIFVLQIEREEAGNVVPVATTTKSGVALNNGDMQGRLSAVGSLDHTGPGPYLNLTIHYPNDQDGGRYICVASITDKTSTLVRLVYEANISTQD